MKKLNFYWLIFVTVKFSSNQILSTYYIRKTKHCTALYNMNKVIFLSQKYYSIFIYSACTGYYLRDNHLWCLITIGFDNWIYIHTDK